MLFEVSFLNNCRRSVHKRYLKEATTPELAIKNCETWLVGQWVRVREDGAQKQAVFEMKKDGTLEKIF